MWLRICSEGAVFVCIVVAARPRDGLCVALIGFFLLVDLLLLLLDFVVRDVTAPLSLAHKVAGSPELVERSDLKLVGGVGAGAQHVACGVL